MISIQAIFESEIKNGDPINIDQISAFVTSKAEKSNFYNDLKGVMDWKDPVIDIENNYDYRIPSKRKKT